MQINPIFNVFLHTLASSNLHLVSKQQWAILIKITNYDIGNCQEAVSDYTKAIVINPNYVQAYNNRAYTSMRMRKYENVLRDLDKTIQIKPNYIQALMNRGDIHNYYYQIDRQAAISDYKELFLYQALMMTIRMFVVNFFLQSIMDGIWVQFLVT